MTAVKKSLILVLLLVIPLLFLVACTDIPNIDPIEELYIDEVGINSVYLGQDFSYDSVSVFVRTRSGKTKEIPISEVEVSGFNKNAAGEQTITVSYAGIVTSFKITVQESAIVDVAIKKLVDEITVVQGTDLVLKEKIELEVTYESGIIIVEKTIENNMISGYSHALPPGAHTINIMYSGYTKPLKITVLPKTVIGVKIDAESKKRIKQQYFVGEEFDPTGLALYLKYDNDTEGVVPISNIPESEIEYIYDFTRATHGSPVRVAYAGYKTLPTELGVIVSYPKVSRVTMVEQPDTIGFTFGDTLYKSPVTSIVEKDKINWANGKLKIDYDNGDTKTVSMEVPEVYVYLNDATTEAISKNLQYTIVGAHRLFIKYENHADKMVELPIYVIPKKPFELKLADINNKLARDFVDGEEITTDHLRYNILYNNKTYDVDGEEFDDPVNWKRLTSNMLANDGSSLSISLSRTDALGYQEINFKYQDVLAGFKVKVVPNDVVGITVIPPTRNYVGVGVYAATLSLEGSTMLIQRRRGASVSMSPIPEEYVTYENPEGVATNSFDTTGQYKLVVTYEGIVEKTIINVEETEVYELEVSPLANNEYTDFNDIPFETLTMTARYINHSNSQESVEHNIAFNKEEHLFKYDEFYSGTQNVVVRYKGCTATIEIKITRNLVASVRLSSASQYVYTNSPDQTAGFNPEMVVEYVFDDGKTKEEKIGANPGSEWSFSGYDLSAIGEQEVTVTRHFADFDLSFKYKIEVLGAEASVYDITVDHTQMGMQTVNGSQVWVVGYKEDINTRYYVEYEDVYGNPAVATGNLKLKVKYTETGDYYDVDVQPYHILKSSYDKNYHEYDSEGNLVKFRTAKIKYGNKIADLNIYIVSRILTGVDVYKLPSITNYAVGQSLRLGDGIAKLTYANSVSSPDPYILGNTYAIVSMSEMYLKSPRYDENKVVEGGLYATQVVKLGFADKETQISVRTYKKVQLGGEGCAYTVSNRTQRYGTTSPVNAQITHTVTSFTSPEFQIKYKINDEWSDVPPLLPGEYGLKIVVVENAYFVSSELVLTDKLQVNKKVISVKSAIVSKEYGSPDPVFVWNLGDGQELEGSDRIYLKVRRDPGENVMFDTSGNIIGYRLYIDLDPSMPTAEADRYQIVNETMQFKIMPKNIPAGVTINYLEPDNSLSNEVTYTLNNIQHRIKEADLTYYVDGEFLEDGSMKPTYHEDPYHVPGSRPVQPGNYLFMIGRNYNVVDQPADGYKFTIMP